MRSLTQRQATACETAATTRCQCRCGGAFHGAKRGDLEYLVQLDEEDPHYIANKDVQLRLPAPVGRAA